MVSAHLDTLELELRKLDGVRTVGFSTQHDVLYIQLFIEADAPAATLPFEATRISQRHSSSPVAVELVRWTDVSTKSKSNTSGLSSIFENTHAAQSVSSEVQAPSLVHAGSIQSFSSRPTTDQEAPISETNLEEQFEQNETQEEMLSNIEEPTSDDQEAEIQESIELADDDIEPISAFGTSFQEPQANEDDQLEVDLTKDIDADADAKLETFESALDVENEVPERREDDQDQENDIERIALLLVTTSAENDEIEVHLSFDELRTIGRAPTNRGLLGAIDATVSAITELTGSDEFHAEWARSLEPGAEHASLVAVGLTNSEGTDTRHGIAGGSSPIEAAARATLNALNRTAVLSASE